MTKKNLNKLLAIFNRNKNFKSIKNWYLLKFTYDDDAVNGGSYYDCKFCFTTTLHWPSGL